MRTGRRRGAAMVAAVAGGLTLLTGTAAEAGAAGAASPARVSAVAADCGGSVKTWTSGAWRYWKYTWTNCGSRGSRKKIDIRNKPDMACKYIPGGSSRTWNYRALRKSPFYPRGFKNC
ncbi:hypothetical protein [Bailinhaonella thermotolerans]|uniref:hypothetical protein n=1 Tax=Bailinhaonella thermotolerans TaxID=1070861 RepID=UPI0011C3FB3E|nr:hypothetical protein [Bailinhaonella thermotolerans]